MTGKEHAKYRMQILQYPVVGNVIFGPVLAVIHWRVPRTHANGDAPAAVVMLTGWGQALPVMHIPMKARIWLVYIGYVT